MWDELPEDVRSELTDERFLTRVHYSRATYAEGCHGPLCRKAERDRGRRRTERKAQANGRQYVPNHDIRESVTQDALLDRITVWHRWHFELQRLEKRLETRFGEQPEEDAVLKDTA